MPEFHPSGPAGSPARTSAPPLLAGKVVLVVGASTGIGAEAARVFAADGASLMLVARSEGPLADISAELERAPSNASSSSWSSGSGGWTGHSTTRG